MYVQQGNHLHFESGDPDSLSPSHLISSFEDDPDLCRPAMSDLPNNSIRGGRGHVEAWKPDMTSEVGQFGGFMVSNNDASDANGPNSTSVGRSTSVSSDESSLFLKDQSDDSPISQASPVAFLMATSSNVAKDNGQRPSAPEIISHHEKPESDHDFMMTLQDKTGRNWTEEEELVFAVHPEAVANYWNKVKGGRGEACRGMWKVWRILAERTVSELKEYSVGYLGSLDKDWVSKAYVREMAPEALDEWQRIKEQEEDARQRYIDPDFTDRDEDDNEDEDENE